jgi:thioredoxin
MAAIDAERWLESQGEVSASLHHLDRLRQVHDALQSRDPKNLESSQQLLAEVEHLLNHSGLTDEQMDHLLRENIEMASELFRFVIEQKTPPRSVEDVTKDLQRLLADYEATASKTLAPATWQEFRQVIGSLMAMSPADQAALQATGLDFAKIVAIASLDGTIPKAHDVLAQIAELQNRVATIDGSAADRWSILETTADEIENLRSEIAALQTPERAVFDSTGPAALVQLEKTLNGWLDPKSIEITDTNFAAEVENFPGSFLLKMGAEWCAPCRQMAPHFSKVADENRDSTLRLGRLDIDQAPTVAAQFGVRSVPTLILFKDGKELRRHLGFMNESQIRDFLAGEEPKSL